MKRKKKGVTSLRSQYEQQCRAGLLTPDPAQRLGLEALDHFLTQLAAPSLLATFRAKLFPPPGRGLYLHGAVGRGKTFLMDMFFGLAPEPKIRQHFHAFMKAVHESMHRYAQEQHSHPLNSTIKELAKKTRLICLDEMEVRDIADAMILGRLLEGLLKAGVHIVTTSNRHPDELYLNGLHRDRFLPTIALIKEHFSCVAMTGPLDHRTARIHDWQHYFTPLSLSTQRTWDETFSKLSNHQAETPLVFTVWGRLVNFPHHCQGFLKTTFQELCLHSYAAGDFLTLSQHIHTLFLDDVPNLATQTQDAVRRFILLIDVLYDQKVSLYIRSEMPLAQLCAEGEWSFEFHRTQSRITEMQTW